MFWLILICPGLLTAYFVFLRPVLKAIPALQKFYSEADGFWAKASALCWHSISVAWGYFLALLGAILTGLDQVGAALGDPDIKQQIITGLQNHPDILAYVTMGISAITIAARLRSMAAKG